jgi:hypothetical protein
VESFHRLLQKLKGYGIGCPGDRIKNRLTLRIALFRENVHMLYVAGSNGKLTFHGWGEIKRQIFQTFGL